MSVQGLNVKWMEAIECFLIQTEVMWSDKFYSFSSNFAIEMQERNTVKMRIKLS